MYETISHIIWSSDKWLPERITWEDIKPNTGNKYPDYKYLLSLVPLILILYSIRDIIIRCFVISYGISIRVKGLLMEPQRNEKLEKVYCYKFLNREQFSEKEISKLSKELQISKENIFRRINAIRSHECPLKLKIFCESSWSFIWHICFFIYGFHMLSGTSWLSNVGECFSNYPYYAISNDLWWYYILSMAYQWLSFVNLFDVEKNNFWGLFLDHILNLALLHISWTVHLTRYGSLIIFFRNSPEIFYHISVMGKFVNYRNVSKVADAIYGILLVNTRIFVMVYIYQMASILVPVIIGDFPGLSMMNLLLVLLVLLDFKFARLTQYFFCSLLDLDFKITP